MLKYPEMVVPLDIPPDEKIMNEYQYNQPRFNPTLYAPHDNESISFYLTLESFNVEIIRSFIRNAIKQFRKSVMYTSYKNYLMGLGLNRCQVLGIDSSMATLEMHHNFLKLDEIALLITNHILNTYGMVNTFMVVRELKRVHAENKVPIVMISKTVHQLYHANKEFVLPGKLCFGFWTELIKEFKMGLTLDISYKIIHFIDESLMYEQGQYKEAPDHELLTLRDELKEWNRYNEYIPNYPTDQFLSIADNNLINQRYLDMYNQTYQIPQQY